MKIAVPTRDGCVDNHFGHCDHYTIFTIEEHRVVAREELPSPQGCGCKSGIAAVLEQMGVEVMLAGSMGEGAKNTLQAHNIKVVRGCSGNIENLVASYLTGYVLDSGVGCAGHGADHECPDHGHSGQPAHTCQHD